MHAYITHSFDTQSNTFNLLTMKKNWMLFCLGFLLVYLLWLFKGDEVLGSDRTVKDPLVDAGVPKDDQRHTRIDMQFTGLLIR